MNSSRPFITSLWQVFSSRPPEHITQQPFDGDLGHLKRLARLQPGDEADASDLWDYTQDLLYGTGIQDDLLAYLLPFCLEAWRRDLLGTHSGYGGFVEYFYPALANKRIFEAHLTLAQTAAVSGFMRQSILDEIDNQRGLAYGGAGARPYRWVTALTTHGVILPDMDKLWAAWWSVDTVGRAVAAVQYSSCLIYGADQNPVFAPWTPDGGGGPPCLWAFGGHLYEHRWLRANVEFLRVALNPRQVDEVLSRAVERLADLPESRLAEQVHEHISLFSDTLAARCVELPRLLETRHQRLTWTK